MADIYVKNIAALRRFFPGLEQKISGVNAEGIVIETAASGDVTAKLNGRYLHSARDPVREARKLVSAGAAVYAAVNGGEKNAEYGGETAFALLGFGLGYTAEAAAALSPNSLIIVIEKHTSILRAALENRDLTGLFDKRLIFILGDDSASVNAALNSVAVKPKNLVTIRNSALQSADSEFYHEVERRIENWRTKEQVNEATLRRFGRRWIRNQAANMEAIRDLPGVELLAGQFDFPALLLAAGPTLNELNGKIAEIKERCIIVAVDTALRFLRNEGVTPDFVVSVDPQYWNTRHLDRCLPPESVLIAESAIYPAALRGKNVRQVFLSGSIYPLSAFIEKRTGAKGRLGAGGSVASTAWDFTAALLRRSAGPSIFIAGLDLAFPDFLTHYKGALFEENAHITANRLNPAETKSFHALRDGFPFFARSADKNNVLTDKRLSLYASWFENRLANAKNHGNLRLSDRGLAIKGLETAQIEDILALPVCRPAITRRFEQVLSGISQKWNDKSEIEARSARYKAARAALIDGLDTAQKTAQAVLSEIAVFENRRHPPDIYHDQAAALLKKIRLLNNTLLESDVKDIADFLSPAAGAIEFGAAENVKDKDKFERYLAAARKTYEDMLECINFTIKRAASQ